MIAVLQRLCIFLGGVVLVGLGMFWFAWAVGHVMAWIHNARGPRR